MSADETPGLAPTMYAFLEGHMARLKDDEGPLKGFAWVDDQEVEDAEGRRWRIDLTVRVTRNYFEATQ